MVIIVSKRLSANQRSLYAYDDHVPIEHNTEISIRRVVGLVLMSQLSQLSPPVHKLLILMLVLEGSSGVYYM